MTTKVGLTEAKAKLSSVVDDVRRTANRYVIERHGQPAAAIISVEDLKKLEATDPPSTSPVGALALVGAWSDVGDAVLDAFLDDVMRSRAEDKGRPVP